ncbi:D-alanyl-D-alanine carboxypeptidase family protein [Patescibacteria group bacterium]
MEEDKKDKIQRDVSSKMSSKIRANILAVIIMLVVAGGGYGVYEYRELSTHDRLLGAELKKTIQEYEAKIVGLENSLLASNATNTKLTNEVLTLKEQLKNEKTVNDSFQAQISQISDMVGILDKLSKTDEELLQKYSKVYFLNEHYVPESLIDIDPKYVYNNKEENQKIHTKVWPYLRSLLEDATKMGADLQIISAFRSYGTQAKIKSSYTVIYGAGANQFSADQGYSEHQLGTTVDFTTSATGDDFSSFENTDAYLWLTLNAHKYGFILSYPEDNIHYKFEPWHWRFVGVDLAGALNRDDLHFYDLDQRVIDGYLISIFDE